jgi:hypothetical protein
MIVAKPPPELIWMSDQCGILAEAYWSVVADLDDPAIRESYRVLAQSYEIMAKSYEHLGILRLRLNHYPGEVDPTYGTNLARCWRHHR